jgi:nicotinamidase-related amidase
MGGKYEKYKQAGLGSRMGFGKKPAIVVVDLNKGCTDPDSPLPPLMDLSSVVANTRRLIDESRQKAIPIIYLTLGPFRADSEDVGLVKVKMPGLKIFTEGSMWSEIDEGLEVRTDDFVVWKKRQSGFFGTDLLMILNGLRVDTVIITGCTTSGCVRATVFDASSHNFHTIIPKECVEDRTDDINEANLFDMNSKNADVLPLEEVITFIRNMDLL